MFPHTSIWFKSAWSLGSHIYTSPKRLPIVIGSGAAVVGAAGTYYFFQQKADTNLTKAPKTFFSKIKTFPFPQTQFPIAAP